MNPRAVVMLWRYTPGPMRDIFDPSPEEQVIVLVERATTRKAERMVESCERCNPDAEIPFDCVLDRLMGADPSMTDYLLESPAGCPSCHRDILEKTLIETRG